MRTSERLLLGCWSGEATEELENFGNACWSGGAGLFEAILLFAWTRLPRGAQLDTVGPPEIDFAGPFLKMCMFL